MNVERLRLALIASGQAESYAFSKRWAERIAAEYDRGDPPAASPAMGLTEPASPPAADVELIAGDANPPHTNPTVASQAASG